jgi:type I restriction enzyme S subunit
MKKGWEIKKLGDVCEFQNGFAFKSNKYKDTGLPVLRITNIQNENLETKKIVFFEPSDYKESFEKYKVEYGDLVVAMSGATTGKIGINQTDTVFYLNQRVGKFIPKKNILKTYLFYFLSTNVEESLRISAGAAQPNLSTEQIKNFKISIPPISEQEEIVSILDNAFESIELAKSNAEKNLKNAKELFESYLQNIFENKGQDWLTSVLKEVCAKITDGTHQTPKYFDDGYVFLSSRNVTSGKIDWDNIKYIDQKQHLEMHKRVAPRIGDILLAKNGTTGVAAMVDRDVVFDIYVSLAHIRVLDSILPDFMLYFINSPVAKSQFNKRLKGSGVPNLHLEEIREVQINYPKSLKEQKKIVNRLDEISNETKKLESIYQQKLNDLEELKKSILQKAFNGELKTSKISA